MIRTMLKHANQLSKFQKLNLYLGGADGCRIIEVNCQLFFSFLDEWKNSLVRLCCLLVFFSPIFWGGHPQQ